MPVDALCGAAFTVDCCAGADGPGSEIPLMPSRKPFNPCLLYTSGPITPGMGAGETPSGSSGSSSNPSQSQQPPPPSPSQPPAATAPPQNAQDTPPEEGVRAVNTVIHAQVNEVIVPVTVKDPKGNPVAGLTWRDFTVYELSLIHISGTICTRTFSLDCMR